MRELLDEGSFFWLDIHEPAASDLEILREEFGFHPLSLKDSWRFNQRPKIDDYDGYVFLVVFGASDDKDSDGLVEVHCFYSDHYLITLHRDEAPSLTAVRERYVRREAPVDDPRACSTGWSTASSTLLPAPRGDRRQDRHARGGHLP